MDAFMALIAAFGFNYAPRGWMFCQGQIINIATNSALFSLLGTMYGGNGSQTFGLPDLRGRVIIGMGQGTGLQNYAQGVPGGVENNTTLVAHTHTATLTNATTTVKAYSGTGTAAAPNSRSNITVLSGSTVNLYSATAPDTVLNIGGGAVAGTIAIGSAGTGTSFSNMQPYCPLNMCISTEGIYPSRN